MINLFKTNFGGFKNSGMNRSTGSSRGNPTGRPVETEKQRMATDFFFCILEENGSEHNFRT